MMMMIILRCACTSNLLKYIVLMIMMNENYLLVIYPQSGSNSLTKYINYKVFIKSINYFYEYYCHITLNI